MVRKVTSIQTIYVYINIYDAYFLYARGDLKIPLKLNCVNDVAVVFVISVFHFKGTDACGCRHRSLLTSVYSFLATIFGANI